MKSKWTPTIAVLILLAALGLAGCSSKHIPEKTAEELSAEGQAAFEKKNYQEAIKVYEKLTDWYPFSSHVKTAEIRIADSHYALEEYEEAILAYKEYERLHPNDEKIPYVIYRTGRSYFDRMVSVDREQATTREALQVFLRLIEQYPESEYAEKAKSHIEEARQHIAGHELYVGKFYFKQKHYKGALNRFLNVIKTYPDLAVAEEARDYAEQTRALMEETEQEEAEEAVIEPTVSGPGQMEEPGITDPSQETFPN